MSENVLRVNPEMVMRKVGANIVVVPIGDSVESIRSIYHLNETAGDVLECIKAGQSEEQLIDSVRDRYHFGSEEEMNASVDEALQVLRDHNILLC